MPPFLADSARAALTRLTDADRADATPDPLERLRAIRSLIAALEQDPAALDAVRDALAAGAEWEQIAEASGLKPAAAKWRWQGSDAEIASRHEAGRKRSARPSSVPTDLPGLSVAEAARRLGVSAQAIYLRISRGTLAASTVQLPDGRSYKRVFPDGMPD
jgi:hypothetical protein